MSRVFGWMQGLGVALLLGVAGASDMGWLALGATAAWVAGGMALVVIGLLGGPAAAWLRARERQETLEIQGGDKALAFPPTDAA